MARQVLFITAFVALVSCQKKAAIIVEEPTINQRLDTFADEGKKINLKEQNILNNYTIEINFEKDSIE